MKYDFLNDSWVAVVAGWKVGPVTGRQLLRLIIAGIIELDTRISRNNSDEWTTVSESPFSEIQSVLIRA